MSQESVDKYGGKREEKRVIFSFGLLFSVLRKKKEQNDERFTTSNQNLFNLTYPPLTILCPFFY